MPTPTTLELSNFTGTALFAPYRQDTQTGMISYIGPGESYDARPVLTLLSTFPKNGSNRLRQRVKMSIPVMDPVDPTKKIDELIFSMEVSLPKNASLETRNDLKAYAADLTQQSIFRAFITDFVTPF